MNGIRLKEERPCRFGRVFFVCLIYYFTARRNCNCSPRNKLISYLSEQSKQHASAEFTIPFNRQQLADFLSVDRSAMSNELCKMRDEGMIEFEKSRFKLCDCIKKE